MKAVVIAAYGSADELEMTEMPEPTVGPNDVKVRMVGAGINPIDWKLRSGAMKAVMPLVFPAVLGRDVSGEVVAIGPTVSHLRIGTRVMGLVMGAYAEFVVAPAETWVEVPESMDLIDAAALPLVLLTGAQLIDEAVRPSKGDVVLVLGAVGGVGRTAVFVAKAAGAKVWAGVRSEQVAEAATLGADGVVAVDSDVDIEKLPLLDGIADTVGGPTIAKLFSKVKAGGTIGSVVGEPAGAKEMGFVVRAFMAHPDAARLGELTNAVADGKLSIPIVKKLPLAEARQGQDIAEHHAGGKVILTGEVKARRSVRGADSQERAAPRS